MEARLIYSHVEEEWLKITSARIIIPKATKLSKDPYL